MNPEDCHRQPMIANWRQLLSEARFRGLSSNSYTALNYIRSNVMIGNSPLIDNDVDIEALQLLFSSAAEHTSLTLGTPFSPCHWSAIVVAYHVVIAGILGYQAPRRCIWIQSRRSERSLILKMRLRKRKENFFDFIDVTRDESTAPKLGSLQLLLADELPQTLNHADDVLLLSLPDGTTYEERLLIRRVQEIGSAQKLTSRLILPSVDVKSGPGLLWPMSLASLALNQVPLTYRETHMNDVFANGAHYSGAVDRSVLLATSSSKFTESVRLATEIACSEFQKRLSWNELSAVIEFRRLVRLETQRCIPGHLLVGKETPSRMASLERRLHTVDPSTRDNLTIGLLYLRDIIAETDLNNSKRGLFENIISSLDAGADLCVLQPQRDLEQDDRLKLYVEEFRTRQGLCPLGSITITSAKDSLVDFRGTAVMTGLPKSSQAAFWRFPFQGRLFAIVHDFEERPAFWAIADALPTAEQHRRQTWQLISDISISKYPLVVDSCSINWDKAYATEDLYNAESFPTLDLSARPRLSELNLRLPAIVDPNTIRLELTDGSTLDCYPGEEHYVLAGTAVKSVPTHRLQLHDRLVLVSNESLSTLRKSVLDASDSARSTQHFEELFDEWRYLCLEFGKTVDSRRAFIAMLRTRGLTKSDAAINSWLDLRVLGPDSCDDIVKCAFVAGNFLLLAHAPRLFEGLEQRRQDHRRLGSWLKRALGTSTTVAKNDAQIVDSTLNLTFGELRRAVTVQEIVAIRSPHEITIEFAASAS